MSLSALIDRMIAAGISPGEAGSIAAEIYAAGVASASVRSAGAERTRRWRHKTSQNVTSDGETETSPSVTERHQASQCDVSPKVPLSKTEDIKKRERQNRGTRIAADWTTLEPERTFAKAEGFSDWEIQREAQKFRDYWTACAGAKGIKLDWSATWRQWIRSGAERAGKSPAPTAGAAAASGFYAEAESEQLAAWDTHLLKTTGRALPRDRKGGWHVKSEWPPGHGELRLVEQREAM